MGHTYRTKTGRVLTDADIEALAAEAERGYDVKRLQTVGLTVEQKGNVAAALKLLVEALLWNDEPAAVAVLRLAWVQLGVALGKEVE